MDDFTIALMTVSSLDEKEIIAHKAKSIFYENELDYFVLYIEIDNFFDEESLKFEEKSIDKNLEYIGRNAIFDSLDYLHNYNFLCDLILNF